MNRNAFFKISILGGFLTFGTPLRADLTTDLVKSGEWFSQEVGDLLAFQAASTHFLPGDTTAFPGFQVGVAGGVSVQKLDRGAYRSIPFTELDRDEVDLPRAVAAPAFVLHGKAGLPWGLDLGLKVGSASFEEKDGDARTKFENGIFGVELRKRLLGGGLSGAVLPDLSLSLALDGASGELTREDRYEGAVQSGGGQLVADTSWETEWDVQAVTLRAVVSKKLLMVTPFVGLGVTRLSGDAETRAVVDVLGGNSGLPDTVARGRAEMDESLGHAVVGLEVAPIPFFRINLSGLAAKERWALSLGVRAQFP
jgi:hypothetical protein